MPCVPFSKDGMTGFVCGARRKPARCKCGSGRPADLLCDWKVGTGTCDAKICNACGSKPAEGKDLCPAHTAEWKAR